MVSSAIVCIDTSIVIIISASVLLLFVPSGHLMGLYKHKTFKHPIRAAVYFYKTKTIDLLDVDRLNDYTVDWMSPIPDEAIAAHDKYVETKVWHEHGAYAPSSGHVLSNRCFVFTTDHGKRADGPNSDDPGKKC